MQDTPQQEYVWPGESSILIHGEALHVHIHIYIYNVYIYLYIFILYNGIDTDETPFICQQ